MRFFLFLGALTLFVSCKENMHTSAEAELIAADSAFNAACQRDGFGKSFIDFADSSVIKMRDHNFPIIGKTELEKAYSDIPNTFTLTWHPVKAAAASSGELGYTFGEWKMELKADSGIDTTLYGNYVTIWKKDKTGEWKYVLDGGNETPKPK